MAEHLGFIGVGKMGGPMAGRLLDAGHTLTIFDANPAALQPLKTRGATVAPSVRALASAVETVFVSLPTPDIVRAVALGDDGIVAGDRVKTFIDLSTTGPRVTAGIAEALGKRGIATVDSPVSGGVAGAQKGTLAVMVACPRPLFVRLEPILKLRQEILRRRQTAPPPAPPRALTSLKQLGGAREFSLSLGERAGVRASPPLTFPQRSHPIGAPIEPLPARPSDPVLIELGALLPRGFLNTIPFERLPEFPRYLKALLTRAERAALNPLKDRQRAQQAAPYLQALTQLQAAPPNSQAARQCLDDFRWMIEEFKVSLFAQELGTAFPISAKRLDQQLERIRAEAAPAQR